MKMVNSLSLVTFKWKIMLFKNKSSVFRLSHDVVTYDVDRDVSTAYRKSSSGDEVDWSCVILYSMVVFQQL